MSKAKKEPEGDGCRHLEHAEVLALQAVREGPGCHVVPLGSGYTTAEVRFLLDDYNHVVVNLYAGRTVAMSLDLELRVIGLRPNPDELWAESEPS